MTATVLNYDNLDEQRRKRARFMAPYEMEIGAKRKRLDEIYEQRRAVLESEICANIESELASVAKRRRRAGRPTHSAGQHDRQAEPATPPPPPAPVTTYDEETVRLMISVALETQKQTLFEPFIEEHIEVLRQHQDALVALEEKAAAALRDRHFTYVS